MSNPLQLAVARAFRESLKERYAVGNIRRFPQCDRMSDEAIAELRDFFLEQIYPDTENRQAFESAFDSLGTVLRSPKKMLPLVGTAVTSFFRLGGRIPAALSAGKYALEAFLEMRRLEQHMLDCALKSDLGAEEIGDRTNFARMVACLPQSKVFAFQRDLVRLFRSLANNKELISVAVEVLRDGNGRTRTRPAPPRKRHGPFRNTRPGGLGGHRHGHRPDRARLVRPPVGDGGREALIIVSICDNHVVRNIHTG